MADIDTLLNTPAQRGAKRIGDIGKTAPHVILQAGGDSMVTQMPLVVLSRNTILWDQRSFSEGSVSGAAAIDAYNNAKLSTISGLGGAAAAVGTGRVEDAVKKLGSALGQAVTGVDGGADYHFHKEKLAVNPNKELTFSGLGFRIFNFEWEFVPTNAKEADAINDFIYRIQHSASPGFAASNTYFSYPDIWNIHFVPRKFMPVIMPCYITDYNINYGAVGKTVLHENGAPVQINIALTFTEGELHMKDKIEGGYWG